jgi:hypothetical protein
VFANAAESSPGQAWDFASASVAGKHSISQGFCGASGKLQLFGAPDAAFANGGKRLQACRDFSLPISVGAIPSF